MMPPLIKYPRTRHILDSRLQEGDEDLTAASFADIAERMLVIEEKVDGANCAFSFSAEGALLLQSRGHYLSGGPRERQFDRFKSWARQIASPLWPKLGYRFVVYGEWLHAKHTIFYDALPDHFLEFDILDRNDGRFLTTAERHEMLEGTNIVSVPVLHRGTIPSPTALLKLLGRSQFKSRDWREKLAAASSRPPHHPGPVAAQTDGSDLAEGLYIKDETDGCVSQRFKYVRHGFLQTVTESGSHWQDRPLLYNLLAADRTGP